MQSEIHRVETNQQECRLSTLVMLCAELGVPAGWLLDLMIRCDTSHHGRIQKDPGFAVLAETLGIADTEGLSRLSLTLGSACLLAAILARVSDPVRRAEFHSYPTEDWRARFLSFADDLAARPPKVDRFQLIQKLRSQPVVQLQKLGLLSRSSLELLRDDLKSPKAKRRCGEFGGEMFSLTFEEASFLLGLSRGPPEYKKIKLTETSDFVTGIGDVKIAPQWPELKQRLQKATEPVGLKPALAKALGVDPTRISQWLSESKNAREPGGDYALRMLKWVEHQEHQAQ
jgi:hypothetical protein